VEVVTLTGAGLTPRAVLAAAESRSTVVLDAGARRRIQAAADTVVAVTRRQQVYGRNTGVGANRDIDVDDDAHGARLLASHATTGLSAYPEEVVRASLLIRLNQIAVGGSGLSPAVPDAIVRLLNTDRLPVLHRGGAIGTGDLGALAELGLALGDAIQSADVLPLLSSNAVTLAECCAVAVHARDLVAAMPFVGALSLVALRGNPEAFDPRVHGRRPQAGQREIAAEMATLLDGLVQEPARVQDPFGLRAFAQVVGPALELVRQLGEVVTVDINAAAENPLVAGDSVLHSGNWHAMPIALALDGLRLALHSVATLSTSRLANLIDPELTGLTRFLASGPPSSSGALMLEYVAHDALALVRSDAQPATLGTATLSRGAEHHASFAPQAAALTTDLLDHLLTVLACELVAAVRAIRLSGMGSQPLDGAGIGVFAAQAEALLPGELTDRSLRDDVAAARTLLGGWGSPS
jgi:histidine ammonia-lyase